MRSHTRKNRLSPLSCLSVRRSTHVSAATTGQIFMKFYTRMFMKICPNTPYPLNSEQMSGNLPQTPSTFYCCRRYKIPIKGLLRAACTATIQNECIVALPLQNGYTNEPQCYAIHTLPTLFISQDKSLVSCNLRFTLHETNCFKTVSSLCVPT